MAAPAHKESRNHIDLFHFFRDHYVQICRKKPTYKFRSLTRPTITANRIPTAFQSNLVLHTLTFQFKSDVMILQAALWGKEKEICMYEKITEGLNVPKDP